MARMMMRTIAVVMALGAVVAGAHAGTIVGSAHDFHARGYTGGDMCAVCHTPHQAPGTAATPVWQYTPAPQAFPLYRSAAAGDDAPAVEVEGTSKLCLSCHDGLVAPDSFGGVAGPDHATSWVGTFLGGDHPVSIVYDTARASRARGLYDPSVATVTAGSGDDAATGAIRDVLLFSDRLQCSSCHDVHDVLTVDGPAGDPLLRVGIHGSELCLTCHRK